MSGPPRLTTFAWRASASLVAALVVALLVPAGATAQSRTVETAGAAFVNSGESGFRSSSR